MLHCLPVLVSLSHVFLKITYLKNSLDYKMNFIVQVNFYSDLLIIFLRVRVIHAFWNLVCRFILCGQLSVLDFSLFFIQHYIYYI